MRDNREIEELSQQARQRLGVEDEGPIDLFTIVKSQKEITLVFYPFPTDMSGLCIKKANLLAISSKITLGRQRFSLAHELYHLYYDERDEYQPTDKEIQTKDQSDIENEANTFASYLLMPYTSLKKELTARTQDKSYLSLEDVVEMEQIFQVSHKAMMYRLSKEGCSTNFDPLNVNILEVAQSLGYGLELYQPMKLENEKVTFGAFIHTAKDLYDQELISSGKYEEYLMDAFREDVLLGLGEKEEYD